MARKLYSLLLWLLLPIILTRLLWRCFKDKTYRRNWLQRFGRVNPSTAGYDIWVHAVSVGEANAATPLVAQLIKQQPNLRILITTMTSTGLERVITTFGNKVGHFYAPYDYSFAVRSFIHKVRPKMLVLIETEIWPNIIHFCAKDDIPVIMLNVRLSSKSRRNYQKFGWLTHPTLHQIQQFGVQSENHRERLISLGVHPSLVHKTGNMKFETKLAAGVHEIAEALRQEWGHDRLVVVAGSTHEHEEGLLLDIFDQLKKIYRELLLVIAPRHPERFDEVCQIVTKSGHTLLRRTEQHGRLSSRVNILVADTLGELPVLYAAADVAFVGRSLLRGSGGGGQNILEPCAVGVPVIFGPFMRNFEEISQLTIASGAGIQIQDIRELQEELSKLLCDPNLRSSMGECGIKMIRENSGATQRSLQILRPLMKKYIG